MGRDEQTDELGVLSSPVLLAGQGVSHENPTALKANSHFWVQLEADSVPPGDVVSSPQGPRLKTYKTRLLPTHMGFNGPLFHKDFKDQKDEAGTRASSATEREP